MRRGRPPKPGTAEEKAAARREQVRNNVRALRERRKQQAVMASAVSSGSYYRLKWNDVDGPDPVLNEKETEPAYENAMNRCSVAPASAHLSIKLDLVNQQSGITPISSSQVDTKNIYALALLATFRKLFLPDAAYLPSDSQSLTRRPWDTQQLLWTPCAFFVTSSFTNASTRDTSLIKITLISIGLLLKSLEHNNQSLRAAAIEMYRRALGGIRARLDLIVQCKPQSQKDVMTLWQSCHAAALFELIENPDVDATHRHLRGVGMLICHMADTFDEEGQAMAWSLLQDYRFAEMGLCLRSRYTSFSSIAKRKFEESISNRNSRSPSSHLNPPRGCRSQGIFVILADIADDICATMLRFDSVQLQSTERNTPAELKDCLKELDHIWQRFGSIEAQLLESYREALVCIDSDSEDGFTNSYTFKRYDVATAWCSNLMAQLYCLETSIETTTLLMEFQAGSAPQLSLEIQHSPTSEDTTKAESVDDYTLADRLYEHRRLLRAICIQLSCCLPAFWQIDKGLAGQALATYPLDAALAMLTKELKRLEADLTKARSTRRKEYVDTVLNDTIRIRSARRFVYQLHTKARQFGMPSFHEDDHDLETPLSSEPS